MSIAFWWIRRDLRLADNPALSAAVASGQQVIPCFVIDPRLMDSPDTAEKRRAFLLGGLAAQAGCRIGQDYPAPIVDHRFARQRTLDAYAQARAEGDA